MKVMRKIIEIDEERCDGCGQCMSGCAEGALQIVDGKARVVSDEYCDGLGACLRECPQDALRIIEREAEEFDEAAVEARLSELEKESGKPKASGGCPSAGIQVFAPHATAQTAKAPSAQEGELTSALTHWPIQIRLIPPHAPFLKGADILVLADCSAVTFAALHQDLIKDRVVMMGCPKFDDAEAYVEKFAEIFRQAGVRSVTTAYMEVPCCAALPVIVKKGIEKAGVDIPLEEVVITRKGERINRIAG